MLGVETARTDISEHHYRHTPFIGYCSDFFVIARSKYHTRAARATTGAYDLGRAAAALDCGDHFLHVQGYHAERRLRAVMRPHNGSQGFAPQKPLGTISYHVYVFSNLGFPASYPC